MKIKERKRFNWKSREKVETIIDDSEQKKIHIEIATEDTHGYAGSNALVLPSAKRKTIKIRKRPQTKLLSKKHRKRLEKIKETKEKKLKTEGLIKALQEVQAKPKDMELFTSLQSTQTLGKKVYLDPLYIEMPVMADPKSQEQLKSSNLKWKELPSIKKERKLRNIILPKKHEENCIGYTSSSSEESEEEISRPKTDVVDECDNAIKFNNKIEQSKGSTKIKNKKNKSINKTETKRNDKKRKIKNNELELENIKRTKYSKIKEIENNEIVTPTEREIINGERKLKNNKKKVTNNKDLKLKNFNEYLDSDQENICKKEKLKNKSKMTKLKEENVEQKFELNNITAKNKNITKKSKSKKDKLCKSPKIQLSKLNSNENKKNSVNNKVSKLNSDMKINGSKENKKKSLKNKILKANSNIDINGSTENKKSLKNKISKVNTDIEIKGSNQTAVPSKKKNNKEKSKIKKKVKSEININEEIANNLSKKKQKLKIKKNKLKDKTKIISNIQEENNNITNNVLQETKSDKLQENPNSEELEKNTKLVPTKMFKLLSRDPKIQKDRLKLPILSEEHAVMEAITENPVTIVVGQTGSGKTTQVPQFLYEAGFTSNGQMIGITEPRRVAAISMSERVAYEMGLSSKEVSYQVRFEGNQSEQTKIKFMTDGILLKELQKDILLEKYSVIVIDEAHERNIQSDILIGLLSRLVVRRNSISKPLRLVIMSATLRIEDFTENKMLFSAPPPVIKIDGRMFEVNLYFNRTTDEDYVAAAFRKVCNIHKQLPEGTILVFLTGQNEIYFLCDKLKQIFPEPPSYEEVKNEKKKLKRNKTIEDIPEIDLNDLATSAHKSNPEEGLGEGDPKDDDWEPFKGKQLEQPLLVLPLFAKLSPHEQRKVFKAPPAGCRLCVVTTNVAETSLTIPNVKYVVDSGKIKQKVYDHVKGVSCFKILWTSKASANQRAGRAGRVCNGYCYRLYSSAVFNDEFEEHSKPEILRKPVDDVVLLLKSFRIRITTFPFPSPPDSIQIQQSIKRLIAMGALRKDENVMKKLNTLKKKIGFIDSTVITEKGEEMSLLPVAPRFAKMISQSNQFPGIMPYVILIVAALTYEDFLLDIRMDRYSTEWEKRLALIRKSWCHTGHGRILGDLMMIINAVLEADKVNNSPKWCSEHGLRHRPLMEIRKLRRQLTKYILDTFPEVELNSELALEPLSESKAKILCQVILTGSTELIAKKVDHTAYLDPTDRAKWKNSYTTLHSEEPVYISSLSILHKEMPQYIMFQDIHQTTKTYLRVVTAISSVWLMTCAPLMCVFSPPMDKPPPRYKANLDGVVCHRKATFGARKWEIPNAEVTFPDCRNLYKWVAYFILNGEICPDLKQYTQYLYEPETLIQPICLRYREIRENFITALMSRNVFNRETLENSWKAQPTFLRNEYFAWFKNETPLYELSRKWPPLKHKENEPS